MKISSKEKRVFFLQLSILLIFGCLGSEDEAPTDDDSENDVSNTEPTSSGSDGDQIDDQSAENSETTNTAPQSTESTDSTSDSTEDSTDDSEILSDISSLKSAKVYDANDMFIGYGIWMSQSYGSLYLPYDEKDSSGNITGEDYIFYALDVSGVANYTFNNTFYYINDSSCSSDKYYASYAYTEVMDNTVVKLCMENTFNEVEADQFWDYYDDYISPYYESQYYYSNFYVVYDTKDKYKISKYVWYDCIDYTYFILKNSNIYTIEDIQNTKVYYKDTIGGSCSELSSSYLNSYNQPYYITYKSFVKLEEFTQNEVSEILQNITYPLSLEYE